HTCAIADAKAYCWGSALFGVLGSGSPTSSVPVAVDTSGVLAGKAIVAMGATCVIADDGKAYCWGIGTTGALGNGESQNSNVPVAVDTSGVLAGKTVTTISGSTCAIADAKAYCWGSGSYGKLGNGDTQDSSVPVAVSPVQQ
ncbi:MAG TPA: hypothetical protein PLY16_01975, partial [Candidatus Saccharibacteria bacterium]|nr:hypothetical protein [Candidatus Saccharibacteria bacterium]